MAKKTNSPNRNQNQALLIAISSTTRDNKKLKPNLLKKP